MKPKPRLLDLFCGAGGCARGYMDAGFDVVGVDEKLQPHYCGEEFYQEDALQVLDSLLAGQVWHGYILASFAVIHASPPCQEYSQSRFMRQVSAKQALIAYPKLIAPVRARLVASKLLWVIENVVGAELPDAIELCGSMFGLPIRRHRWFSSSQLLFAPGACQHTDSCINPVGGKIRGYGSLATTQTFRDKKGSVRRRESYLRLEVGRAAMGIDWMSKPEICQAIPPAYTRWIGEQLMPVVLAALALEQETEQEVA